MPKPTDQDKLIGKHPTNDGFFSRWLGCEDSPITLTQKYRKLFEAPNERDKAIKQISEWIITHHLDQRKLNRIKGKKKIYDKYEFKCYLKEQKPLPTIETTQKGNCAEIILAEYLRATSGLDLFVYRFRYNTNVDQSMKGDDVLLFDKGNLYNKVLVGEAKFRSKPSTQVVNELIDFSDATKLPLSITFVADRLSQFGEEKFAEKLEELNSDLHKGKVPIVKVGFLLSNLDAPQYLVKYANSKNPNFMSVTLGIREPDEIVQKSFEEAQNFLENIDQNMPNRKFLIRMGELVSIDSIKNLLKVIKSFAGIKV